MASDRIRSEAAIIQEFLAPLTAGFPGALGLKDDCAFAAPSPGHDFVFKTDAVAEDVHFLPDDRPEDIGWKALAVNVSDLAAKGARPVGYLMSLAFPEAPTRLWMTGFARGLSEAQAAFDIHLMGGDTDRRPGPIAITPMVIGEVPAGRMVRRGAARAGDIVFVSGTLGDAALGLRLRRDSDCATRWKLPASKAIHLIGSYVRPQPRVSITAAILAHAGAAMDVSDGLLKDLGRMCRASGVGARIEYDVLPVSDAFAAVRSIDDALAARALLAGDDYEILAAVAPQNAEIFRAACFVARVPVTAIGRFELGDEVVVLDRRGLPMQIAGTGWDHF